MPVARPAEQFWQRGSPLFYWDSMQIVVVRIVLPRCSSKAAQRGYWRAANRGDLRVLPDRCQLRRRRAPMRQNGPPGTAKGLRAKPRQPRPQALKRAASCTTTDLSPCGCSLGSNSEWQTNFCIARQVPHLGVLLTGRLSLRRHPNALQQSSICVAPPALLDGVELLTCLCRVRTGHDPRTGARWARASERARDQPWSAAARGLRCGQGYGDQEGFGGQTRGCGGSRGT